MTKPLVLAITGASGVIYGIEALRALNSLGLPVHLILSEAAVRNIAIETEHDPEQVKALADAVHSNRDLAAPIASGSFPAMGMLVAPCSVKTLSGIANSYADNLIVRAADVSIKERRPLVLMVRETPLHKGHIDLMARAADMGAVILPPIPAFYHRPQTIEDIVRQSVGKALDQFGIEHDLFRRWDGSDATSG